MARSWPFDEHRTITFTGLGGWKEIAKKVRNELGLLLRWNFSCPGAILEMAVLGFYNASQIIRNDLPPENYNDIVCSATRSSEVWSHQRKQRPTLAFAMASSRDWRWYKTLPVVPRWQHADARKRWMVYARMMLASIFSVCRSSQSVF